MRPNAPGSYDYEAHEAARAGTRQMPDQSATIAGLRSQLKAYKARDRELKYALQMEQELAMLRAENARLRKECSQPHLSELKRENDYLNQKTVTLGIALFNAEKALRAKEAEVRALEEQLANLRSRQASR